MSLSNHQHHARHADKRRNPVWNSLAFIALMLRQVSKQCQRQLLTGLAKLMLVMFSLLAYGQASATCSISFTAAAGGTVTFEAANSQFAGQPARYKFLFSPSDNTACGNPDLFGINDVNGNATVMNDEGVVTNTSKYISSTKGTNNVIIHSVNNYGSNDFSGFYYTIPTGLSNTTDTFNFVDGNSAGISTVTVTIPAVPGAPTIGTATAGNGQATVTFTAPASNGGSTIVGYTVTSNPGSFTATSTGSTATPITVTGLTNGTAYTFTVTATNAIGTSSASAASNSVTPQTVPGAPTIGTATAGDTTASVAFTAPASNGGSAITGYTVTSNPGGKTGTGTASPISVSGLTNGTAYTFTVTATNTNGTSTASAASNAVTPQATQTAQTITFNNPGTQNFGTTPTLTASATSSLAVTFTTATASVCSITTGGVLTFATTGTCTINADQSGDATYSAAPQKSQSFTVSAVAPGAPTSPVGTAGSGQVTVAFTAPVSNGGSSITSYTVTSSPGGFTGSGPASPIIVAGLANGTAYTFTVTATNSAGTSSASSASAAVTPKSAQTITFTNPGAKNFGTTPTLTATATSGLTPTFTSATTGICTITSGGVLTFVTAGNCTINADQAGNGTYLAATTVGQTFAVNAIVPDAPSSLTGTAGNGQISVAFTAPVSNGGSAVIDYTVTSNPGGFTATGAASPLIVSGLINGTPYTFTVTARNIAGSSSASTASAAVTPKAPQTITFTNPGAQNFGTTPSLTATTSSGLTATFTSITPSVCTITSGGALTFITAGNCTINADQAGNGTYLPATTIGRTFSVNPVISGAPTSPVGTAGNSLVSVAFSAPSFNGGATITGYTVTSSPGGLTSTGAASPITVNGLTNGTAYTFTVTATNLAGTSAASTASAAVTPKAPQTITFTNPGSQTLGTPVTVTATASSGLTVTFTSSTPGICSVTPGGAVSSISAGVCTINANQAGNTNYAAATTVTQSFSFTALPVGVVTFATPGSALVTMGSTFINVASSSLSGGGFGAITYSSSNAAIATVSATGVVTPVSTGTVIISATQAAVPGVNDQATATYTLTVAPLVIGTVSFATPGSASVMMGTTLSNPATSTLTGGSYGAITYSSSNTAVATVSANGTITPVSVGTSTITATQAAVPGVNGQATQTYTLTVLPLVVGNLTFATPNAASVMMGNTLSNPATSTLSGGSYGAISYSSSNTAVATVSAAGVVTPFSVGTSTITATQAAVPGVNAQASQSYLLTVGKNAQAALSVASDKTTMFKVTGTATLTVTGGSGTGAVSTAVTTGSCTIAGNVVTAGNAAETCVITATKAADANYSAATATVSIQVVSVATSNVTLASSSLNPMAGQSVNLTATVNPSAATGTVSFMDGTTLIAKVNVSGGVASLTTSTLAVGSHSLTVVYSGDANTASSTSAAIVVNVNVRPDPVNNPLVKQNIVSQATTTQRFTVAQMTNIYNHVQILHSDFNIRNRFGAGLNVPYLDTLRLVGGKILDNFSGPQEKEGLVGEFGTVKTAEYQRRAKAPFAQDGMTHQKEKRVAKDEEADQEPVISDDVPRIAGMPAGFWTAGNIDVGSLDAQDGSRTKFSSAGLTLGMDVMVNSRLIAGGSIGYAKDDATFDNLGSESKAKQWSGSLYATYKPEKYWFVDGVLGAGHVTYDNRRWDNSNNVLLSGDRKGKIIYGSLSLTREMVLQQFRVHPFGRVDVINVKLDSYSEQGSPMALTFKDSSFTNSTVTGGLDIFKDYFFASGQVTPSLKLQLSHRTSGDVNQSVYYADMGVSGPTYNAIVTGIPEDVQSLGLGLNFKNRRGFQANFTWLGSMGANAYRANSFRLDLRFGF